jgi:hypothetical protein
MPPKSNDIEAGQAIKRLPSNAELVPHAGKITMDEPAYFGKGIIKDFKTTVGTHWIGVSRHQEQKHKQSTSKLTCSTAHSEYRK